MIVFLGDSITQWWDLEYFNHYFGMYTPVNLGMSGNTSMDTLEYMELSHFNNLKPSNVVLHIGTNDGGYQMSTGETARNIEKICSLVFEHSPNSKILLIGPLPRGERVSDRHNIYNREVNKILKASKKDSRITYIDIGSMFTDDNDIISKDIMYDYIHLTKRGYHILSEAVSEFLFSSSQAQMLASPVVPSASCLS
jgi:beta-glucosidase